MYMLQAREQGRLRVHSRVELQYADAGLISEGQICEEVRIHGVSISFNQVCAQKFLSITDSGGSSCRENDHTRILAEASETSVAIVVVSSYGK